MSVESKKSCGMCSLAHAACLRCVDCGLSLCEEGKKIHDRIPSCSGHRVVLLADLLAQPELLAQVHALGSKLSNSIGRANLALDQLTNNYTTISCQITHDFRQLRSALEVREKVLQQQLEDLYKQSFSKITSQRGAMRQQNDEILQAEKELKEGDEMAVVTLKSALRALPQNVINEVLEYSIRPGIWSELSQLGKVEEESCTATLSGPLKVQAFTPAVYTLTCRNRRGQPRAGENFLVGLQGEAKVQDMGGGSYQLTVVLQQSEQLVVRLRGAHVRGSPYPIEVYTQEKLVRAWGKGGEEPGQFQWPLGVAVSSEGVVGVADSGNNRIQIFRTDGTFLQTWTSTGVCDIVFSETEIFVVDQTNHRIQVFGKEGTLLRMWGSKGSAHGQFNLPRGAAVSKNGYVFVADDGNDRVQVFDVNGSFICAWGAAGSACGQFSGVGGIVVAGEEVFVSDWNNHRIQVFDTQGNFLRMWGSEGGGLGQFRHPFRLAVSTAGELLVTDYHNHRVQVFHTSGAFIRMWGAQGEAQGQFYGPTGIAVSPDGAIFVMDCCNHRIQVFR